MPGVTPSTFPRRQASLIACRFSFSGQLAAACNLVALRGRFEAEIMGLICSR
jgi:hypothetical protein